MHHLDHGPLVSDEGVEAQPPQLHAELKYNHHQGEQLQGRMHLQPSSRRRCSPPAPAKHPPPTPASCQSQLAPFSPEAGASGRDHSQVHRSPGTKVWWQSDGAPPQNVPVSPITESLGAVHSLQQGPQARLAIQCCSRGLYDPPPVLPQGLPVLSLHGVSALLECSIPGLPRGHSRKCQAGAQGRQGPHTERAAAEAGPWTAPSGRRGGCVRRGRPPALWRSWGG